MRQLDNLFGPYIKEFKKKFNDLPIIDISFSNVGDGENGESIYRVSTGYLDNYISEIISSDDEWERVGKMFNKLIEDTDESLRRLAEHRSRINTTVIDMPMFRDYGGNTFTPGTFIPVMADEPVEVRPRPISFEDFCEELEEV